MTQAIQPEMAFVVLIFGGFAVNELLKTASGRHQHRNCPGCGRCRVCGRRPKP